MTTAQIIMMMVAVVFDILSLRESGGLVRAILLLYGTLVKYLDARIPDQFS